MSPPPNFPVMPAGLTVEVIAIVPSRYYRVPCYFFTVPTMAHNQWYRPTLLSIGTNINDIDLGVVVAAAAAALQPRTYHVPFPCVRFSQHDRRPVVGALSLVA